MDRCTVCKTTLNIHSDVTRDITYCTKCHFVITESTIVSDTQYTPDSKGNSVLQGQYVSPDDTRRLVNRRFITTNSYLKVKADLKAIGSSLGIGDAVVEAAFRFYKTAQNQRFTRGRKTHIFLAACLYTACRMARTDHMLIDFSVSIRVNVYKIAAMYFKLIQSQKISDIQYLKPEHYTSRFCNTLRIEDTKVNTTAKRLMERMDHDFITTGRKPSGVCGAAILVASRIHGQERSVEEVADAVKVCEVTINRRVEEFRNTASASLTVGEFNTLWLKKEEDPPVIKKRNREVAVVGVAEGRGERETEIPTPESTQIQEQEQEEEELSSLGEEEEELLLSPEEVKEKKAMWEAMHEEYLLEQMKRSQVKAKKVEKKKKKESEKKGDEKSVKKAFSSKINYEAMKDLFGPCAGEGVNCE